MADVPGAPVPPVAPKQRPYWMPDTQGFLAIAIVLFMGTIVLFLLQSVPKFDDKTQGVLMVVLGVMTGCLKDVYSYFFGSSRGEEKKDGVISTIAQAPTPPVMVPAEAVAPTLDTLAGVQLTEIELAHFNKLVDDDAKKKFLAMSPEQRQQVILRGI